MPFLSTLGSGSTASLGFGKYDHYPFNGFNAVAYHPGNIVGNFTDIACNSSGTMIAVGADNSNNGYYSISTNGTTWTTPALFNGVSGANMYNPGIAVSPTTGLWVAVGQNGNTPTYSYSSNNGVTWTTPAALAGFASQFGIGTGKIACNTNGVWVVVGTTSGLTMGYSTSANGTTWTTPVTLGASTSNGGLDGIAWKSSTGTWVSVGNANNGLFYTTSTNATSWSTITSTANTTASIYFNNLSISPLGTFFTCGADNGNGGSGNSGRFYYWTSTNGTVWSGPNLINGNTTAMSTNGGYSAFGITGKLVVVTYTTANSTGTPYYYFTSDLVNWTGPVAMVATNGYTPNSICFNPVLGKYVTVGRDYSNGNIFAYTISK